MQDKLLRKRSEIPSEDTWDLRDLFTSDEKWAAENDALHASLPQFAPYQGRLGQDAATLLSYLRLEDEMGVRLEKLYGYASCKSDQDTADSFYQDCKGKALATCVAFSGATSFSTPEIMAIPDETLDRFYADEPALEEYRRSLEKLRRMKSHILSPAEEKLLAAAGEMADSPDTVSGILHNADMKYPAAADSAGALHPITDTDFTVLLQSKDRTLRRNTFHAYYETLGQFQNTNAALLDAQFRQLRFFADARGYESTLRAALFQTEVPAEVYTNLITAVHENLPQMYDYISLRKSCLGVDELHMYDIYTPLMADSHEKISFSEAKETVLEALSVLGKDYTDILRKGFAHRWIDVYPNEGKRSGAYSSGSSRPHPYVLLNQKDTLESMFTLAHEMGHALHSYHSCKAQPINTSDYVICVAEVASTCNEVLLMRYLLKKTADPSRRAHLVNYFLDQFRTTVYRQTMFAEFELEMGRMAENGQTLTAQALNEKYLALNRLYYGPDMISDPEIALEWARIPHFYYNYYVFQYATGFCAAVAIAERILTEGAPAVRDYKKFLSGGSSTDPISLLKLADVDMSTPAPIHSALKLFGRLIEELRGLI